MRPAPALGVQLYRVQVGVRDPQNRGVIWHYTSVFPPADRYADFTTAWEPVVFEATGNRSLGVFTDATDAVRAWRAFVPFILSAA